MRRLKALHTANWIESEKSIEDNQDDGSEKRSAGVEKQQDVPSLPLKQSGVTA